MAQSSRSASRKEIVQRLEIIGLPAEHSVEALRLEIQQLARRYGLGPEDVRVEVVDSPVARASRRPASASLSPAPVVRLRRRARPRPR